LVERRLRLRRQRRRIRLEEHAVTHAYLEFLRASRSGSPKPGLQVLLLIGAAAGDERRGDERSRENSSERQTERHRQNSCARRLRERVTISGLSGRQGLRLTLT